MIPIPIPGPCLPSDRSEQNALAGFERLCGLVGPYRLRFEPRDPRHKLPNGKLSASGIEVCYALFDDGKTPYAVCNA